MLPLYCGLERDLDFGSEYHGDRGPASDPFAVVSQYGKLHGIDGLRVADASIMPDCVRANTNATAMLIGERMAALFG